jgi:hypothetical protein
MISSDQAWIIIVGEFVVGALLGLAVAGVVLRSRLGRLLGFVTSFCSGAVFLFTLGFCGWASWSPYMWGAYPRIANLSQNRPYSLAVLSCFLVAAIMSLASLKRKQPAQT